MIPNQSHPAIGCLARISHKGRREIVEMSMFTRRTWGNGWWRIEIRRNHFLSSNAVYMLISTIVVDRLWEIRVRVHSKITLPFGISSFSRLFPMLNHSSSTVFVNVLQSPDTDWRKRVGFCYNLEERLASVDFCYIFVPFQPSFFSETKWLK